MNLQISTGSYKLIHSCSIIQYCDDPIEIKVEDVFTDPLVILFNFIRDETNNECRTFDDSVNGEVGNIFKVTIVNCDIGSTGVFPTNRCYCGKRFFVSYHVITEGVHPDVLRNFTFNLYVEA